uniref:Uncharacterized protein n=1 Tax=Rhizophagus irregularis (strain DAOM 181602 / DAOM 197198 / MUCL 43194) TaxID=747089 RepID=U9UFR1_RHIID
MFHFYSFCRNPTAIKVFDSLDAEFRRSQFPFKHFEDDNSKCHLFYFVFNERLLKFVFLFYMETRDLKSKSSKILDTISKELNTVKPRCTDILYTDKWSIPINFNYPIS